MQNTLQVETFSLILMNMQLTITNRLAILAASFIAVFGVAFTALAFTELEIEVDVYDDKIEVEVEYQDGDTKVEEKYTFETTDLDEVYEALASELGITVDEVEDAVTKVTDEDEDEDEEEEEEEDEDEDEDEEEEEEEDEDSSDMVCTKTKGHGFGVMTKCVNAEVKELKKNKEYRNEIKEEWREYGKSTDRAVLQSQLRELLLVLIQLLQQQMLLQQDN